MPDQSPPLNVAAEAYHLAHVWSSQQKLSSELLQKIGKRFADIHHAGVNGQFPAKANRRELKKGQMHAIGALVLWTLSSDKELLKDLPHRHVSAVLCGDQCPNRPINDDVVGVEAGGVDA